MQLHVLGQNLYSLWVRLASSLLVQVQTAVAPWLCVSSFFNVTLLVDNFFFSVNGSRESMHTYVRLFNPLGFE